jgi:hypothetical protein
MTEFQFFIELAKYIGFPVLIFVIFYIYHHSQTEILLKTIKNMEEREQKLNEYLANQTEILQWVSSCLSRLEYKIDIGIDCPIRKESLK